MKNKVAVTLRKDIVLTEIFSFVFFPSREPEVGIFEVVSSLNKSSLPAAGNVYKAPYFITSL